VLPHKITSQRNGCHTDDLLGRLVLNLQVQGAYVLRVRRVRQSATVSTSAFPISARSIRPKVEGWPHSVRHLGSGSEAAPL